MTRKAALAGLALAATTAAIGASVANSSDGPDARASTSFDLVLRLRDAEVTQVDAPPAHTDANPEDSPGDSVVLNAPVRNAGGVKLGTLDAIFTATAGGDREQVVGTFTLKGGQIAVHGIDGSATIDRIAIIGGTGRYARARGVLTAREAGSQRRFHLSFTR